MAGAGCKSALFESPTIHEGSIVNDFELGIWTEVGKICLIANATRIIPGNHPTWRTVQPHSVYRAETYGLGEDDYDFFE